ncbi:MAG: ABC transporter permease [Candidatus Altimarinota bacterium]
MYLKLAQQYLKNKPSRTFLTALAICVSICSLTLFSALHTGLKNFFFNDTRNPLTRITVQPAGQIGGYFNPVNAFKSTQLTAEQISSLEKIPHVKTVSPQGSLKGISSLQINLYGQWLQTDALIFSLPYQIISDSKVEESQWQAIDNQPTPVIVSTLLIDLYNYSFASINNLPRLNEQNFVGTEIRILLNQSTLFNSSNSQPIVLDAKIVGFSSQAKLIGITIPPAALEKINRDNLNQTEIGYLNALVDIDSVMNLDDVKTAISDLGLQANTAEQNLASLNNYFQIFNLAFSIINIVIFFITGLMIANTFLANTNERIKDIGILRTLGFSQVNLRKTFLWEAAILGFFGGLTGFIFAITIGLISNQILQNQLSDLNNKPEQFFSFDPALFLFVMVFAILFCLIFSFLPADKASKLDPVQALNK